MKKQLIELFEKKPSGFLKLVEKKLEEKTTAVVQEEKKNVYRNGIKGVVNKTEDNVAADNAKITAGVDKYTDDKKHVKDMPKKSGKRGTDELSQMIAWENGELDEDETVALFQQLVDSGLAWQLQGMYGRMAQQLIDAGLVHKN
jgi:hypothetical protein